MTDIEAIAEIIATYHKYGWILRRVLLTTSSSEKLDKDRTVLFGNVTISDSAVDAAWFSRPPKSGLVSWEIRYLGDIPFAMLEKVDESDPKFENILGGIERRLCETISAKKVSA